MSKIFVLIFDLAVLSLALWLYRNVNPWFVFIAAGIFLIPLLRNFGILRELDEREKYYDRLSSNIALVTVFLLTMLVVALGSALGHDLYFAFIVIPLVAKASIYAGFTYSKKIVITYVGRVMSLIYLGFVLLSHGISITSLIEAVPGIIFLVITELARKWRFAGIGYLAYAILISYVYIPKVTNSSLLITYVILLLPMVILTIRTFQKEETEFE
jgi:uncharacterized membrane protein